MKNALTLCLLATLPAVAQEAVDVANFPTAQAEGWGTFTIPVPPGYEISCFKGEQDFRFLLAKPKQSPALEIYNGFAPPAAEEGERCYADIAGKRQRGHVVTREDGTSVHEFLLEDGPAGSSYLVTLYPCEDAAAIAAALKGIQFEEKSARKSTETVPPADAPMTPRTFRAKGVFALPVPDDMRVAESKADEAFLFHFLTPQGTCVLSIYCGYTPAVQTGGKPCTAVIAGKETEGNKLSDDTEPGIALLAPVPGKVPTEGEEYVLPGGAEGALYHITVYDSPRRAQVLGMLAAMSMSGGSPLPESAKQQVAALRESAEICVRNADIILAKVKDRASAEAALSELRPLADTMQANDKAAAALQSRYGRALHAYLHAPDKSDTLPSKSGNKFENEIQRVHEADCYGSEALEELLLRFMGIVND